LLPASRRKSKPIKPLEAVGIGENCRKSRGLTRSGTAAPFELTPGEEASDESADDEEMGTGLDPQRPPSGVADPDRWDLSGSGEHRGYSHRRWRLRHGIRRMAVTESREEALLSHGRGPGGRR
jgi:hypothetical protein